MVSANMEVPVRGTANFLPFQGGAQRLLREDGRDRWVALIPPPFSKRWAGVFGHRPFAFSISMGIKNVLDDLLSSNYSGSIFVREVSCNSNQGGLMKDTYLNANLLISAAGIKLSC